MEESINQAFCEVYDILLHTKADLYAKIPKSFIKMIKENRDLKYKFTIDYSKNINEQKLQHETRVILGLIYRDYLCDPEEREKLLTEERKELQKIEEEKSIKYNPDDLFKNKIKPKQNNDTLEENKIYINNIEGQVNENSINNVARKINENSINNLPEQEKYPIEIKKQNIFTRLITFIKRIINKL